MWSLFSQMKLENLMISKTEEVKMNPKKESWKELASATLARILCFNKRRASEPARMLVTAFDNRTVWEKGNTDIEKSLKPIERELMKK